MPVQPNSKPSNPKMPAVAHLRRSFAESVIGKMKTGIVINAVNALLIVVRTEIEIGEIVLTVVTAHDRHAIAAAGARCI